MHDAQREVLGCRRTIGRPRQCSAGNAGYLAAHPVVFFCCCCRHAANACASFALLASEVTVDFVLQTDGADSCLASHLSWQSRPP